MRPVRLLVLAAAIAAGLAASPAIATATDTTPSAPIVIAEGHYPVN